MISDRRIETSGNVHYIIHRLPGDEAEVNTRDNTGRINIKLPGTSFPPPEHDGTHSQSSPPPLRHSSESLSINPR